MRDQPRSASKQMETRIETEIKIGPTIRRQEETTIKMFSGENAEKKRIEENKKRI